MSDIFAAEQTVKTMLTNGKQVVQEAIASITATGKSIVGMVAAFSGGGDSIVSTHFAMENYPGCIVFNADTMIGLGPARDHIEKTIAKYNWPARIIKAEAKGPPKRTPTNGHVVDNWIEGRTAYEEMVLNHGFAGKAMHSRMYQRLKERPLEQLSREIKNGTRGGVIAIISGIRSDESAIRAGYKRAWALNKNWLWINPFYWNTAADFHDYREEFGLPKNPVKDRCGISGECCCGAFGSPAERQSYREIDPVFSEYLDELESRVKQRFPWGWGQCPPKSWMDQKKGQEFLFDSHEAIAFQPMCVGCNNGRR